MECKNCKSGIDTSMMDAQVVEIGGEELVQITVQCGECDYTHFAHLPCSKLELF